MDAALWQHPLIYLSLQAIGLVLKVKIFHFLLTTFAIWFQGIFNLAFHWKCFISKFTQQLFYFVLLSSLHYTLRKKITTQSLIIA